MTKNIVSFELYLPWFKVQLSYKHISLFSGNVIGLSLQPIAESSLREFECATKSQVGANSLFFEKNLD